MLKKSQISIFVIVSAIIIIVSAFLFFNDNYSLFYSPENELSSELQEEVTTCLSSSSELGVFLLGFQGGYISIPEEIRNDPTRRLTFNADESLDEGQFTIPNWDSELGDIPTREDMEEDLEQFVNEDARGCIDSNLKSYEDYLTLEYSLDDISVDASINDENVEIETDFKVDFEEKSGDIDSQISEYYINLEDTKLGDLHSLAVEIYNVEEQSRVFEELVMDQIYSSGERSSEDTSMPTEGMTFSCNPQIWTKNELKETLAQLNNNNFDYLYFEGTRSIEDRFETNLGGEFEGLRDYYQNSANNREISYKQSLQNTKSSFQEFEVDVMMPTSDFTGSQGFGNQFPYRTFEISPSNGEVVESIDMEVDMGAKLPIPCVQIFHHLYTLDYDLMIELQDYTDEGEEDLLFQFPLRVEIEDNSPKEAPQSGIETQEPATATNDNFCEEENRNTKTQIYVQNDNTNEYLRNANVSYKCLGLSCDLGSPEKPTYGFEEIIRPDADPVINASLGYCVGGELEVEKDGYFQIGQNPERIETSGNQEISPITALMVPTKEFEVDATTLTATSYSTCNSFSRETGEFYINIENQGYDFESTAYYPTSSSGFMDSIELLEKPDTAYNISVVYMNSGKPYGILELENKVLDYSAGNSLQIDIPTSDLPLEEGNARTYFEEIDEILENDEFICPGIDYGIRIR